MKKLSGKKQFVAGFVLGGMLFGSVNAIAANGITALPSSQSLYVDGQKITTQAYNIDGSNYFKLRDIGQAINFAVAYDEQNDAIKVDTTKDYGTEQETAEPTVRTQLATQVTVNFAETSEAEQKQNEEQTQTIIESSSKLQANKSVAPQFDVGGRPISIATNTGDIIYGTGNDKTRNAHAIGGWDGCFEITSTGKPEEAPLGDYNPNWQGYSDIKFPDPIPAYSNIDNSVWEDGRSLFVFNAHETQRLIDELYRTLYKTPECFTDGKLNCKVMIGMTENSFNANHFYPYRASEVSKQVIGGNRVYMVYAVDIYQNGMFDCTKYAVRETGWYDYKTDAITLSDWDEIITSDTAVVSRRQDK